MSDFPRRCQMQKWCEAEHKIADAMQAVEMMGADLRLTDAVCLLGASRDRVADFVDGVEGKRTMPRDVSVGAVLPAEHAPPDVDDLRQLADRWKRTAIQRAAEVSVRGIPTPQEVAYVKKGGANGLYEAAIDLELLLGSRPALAGRPFTDEQIHAALIESPRATTVRLTDAEAVPLVRAAMERLHGD